MQVIYDQAVEQSKTLPPTEVPESLGLLLLTVETHKHMKNSGDSHMISKEDTYRAVWAATWSCNYYWEQRKDSQQARPYPEVKVALVPRDMFRILSWQICIHTKKMPSASCLSLYHLSAA